MEFSHLSKSQDFCLDDGKHRFFAYVSPMFYDVLLCFTNVLSMVYYLVSMFYLCFTTLYLYSNLIPSVLSSHLRYTVNKKKPRPFCSSSPGCCKSLTSNSSPRPHKRQFLSSEWESDMWKPWICEDPTEFLVKFPEWRCNVKSGHSTLPWLLYRKWIKSLTIRIPHLGTFH